MALFSQNRWQNFDSWVKFGNRLFELISVKVVKNSKSYSLPLISKLPVTYKWDIPCPFGTLICCKTVSFISRTFSSHLYFWGFLFSPALITSGPDFSISWNTAFLSNKAKFFSKSKSSRYVVAGALKHSSLDWECLRNSIFLGDEGFLRLISLAEEKKQHI